MKIFINALGADMGGAIRHLTSFLPEVGIAAPHFEFIVLMRAKVPRIEVSDNVHLERVDSSFGGGWVKRVAGDVFFQPRRLTRENFSAMVSMLNMGPIWAPVPHILFQRNSLYYCRHFLERVGGRRKLTVLFRRRLALASMKRADIIVTPTNAMAQMIQETCPEIANRHFATLMHGHENNTMQASLEPIYVNRIKEARGIRLLYATHPGLHKGFEILFNAFAVLLGRGVDATLLTTIEHSDAPDEVAMYERQLLKLGLRDRVVFLGRVPQHQIGSVYEACDIMLYPSLCESFGFPMIEAMSHGIPIVAASTAVNREMCASAALYYDPLDPIQACDCIEMAMRPDIQSRLKDSAARRITDFDWSWKRYAKDFVRLIETVT